MRTLSVAVDFPIPQYLEVVAETSVPLISLKIILMEIPG